MNKPTTKKLTLNKAIVKKCGLGLARTGIKAGLMGSLMSCNMSCARLSNCAEADC